MATNRVDNPSKAETLLKRRRAQIDRAYQSRLKPKMSKAARKALESERTRQLALARAEFARLSHAKAPRKITITKPVVFKSRPIPSPPPRKTRQIPIGGTPHIIERSTRAEAPREDMPVSEHWRYFDADGQPSSPWDLPAGPQYEGDDVDEQPESDTPFELGEVFASEDYSYEDIEADWGGYDYSDTGYADENT